MHSPFCPTLRAYLLKSSIDMRCSFYLFRCLGNHCNEGWVVCVAPILPWRTSQWFLLLILFHDFPSQIKHDTRIEICSLCFLKWYANELCVKSFGLKNKYLSCRVEHYISELHLLNLDNVVLVELEL